MQKNPSEATGSVRAVCAASVLSCILSYVVRVFYCGKSFPCGIAYDLACACTVLLVSPPRLEAWRLSRSLAISLIAAGSSLLALVLFRILGGLPAMAVILVNCIPLLLFQTQLCIRMLRDRNFLAVGMSGWDILQGYIRMLITLYFVVIAALAYTSFVQLPSIRWLFDVLLAVLFAWLLMRSIAERPALSGLDASRTAAVMKPSGAYPGDPPYQVLFARLCHYMEERKPFLDPDLKMERVVKDLYTNRGYLSRMINACSGLNFPQFINGYRIRYAMEVFRSDTSLKVEELALLSGFKGKGTFGVAFRLFVNSTPKDWCREVRDSQEGIRPASPQAKDR